MTDILTRLGSRAVERSIAAGEAFRCVYIDCPFERWIKFCPTQKKLTRVVCNVYVDGSWSRVEHYHRDCYLAQGEPWGTPTEMLRPDRLKRR